MLRVVLKQCQQISKRISNHPEWDMDSLIEIFQSRPKQLTNTGWTQMLTWLKTSQQWANKVNLLAFPVTNIKPLHEHWRCLDEATNCAFTLSTFVTWYWGTIIVHHIKPWNISILSYCISMQPFLSRLNLTHLFTSAIAYARSTKT